MRTDGQTGMTKLIVALPTFMRRLKTTDTEFLVMQPSSISLLVRVLSLVSLSPRNVLSEM
jgi:hypothetical protein